LCLRSRMVPLQTRWSPVSTSVSSLLVAIYFTFRHWQITHLCTLIWIKSEFIHLLFRPCASNLHHSLTRQKGITTSMISLYHPQRLHGCAANFCLSSTVSGMRIRTITVPMILGCLHNMNPRWKYAGGEPLGSQVYSAATKHLHNREFDSFYVQQSIWFLGARGFGGVTCILAGGYHKFEGKSSVIVFNVYKIQCLYMPVN